MITFKREEFGVGHLAFLTAVEGGEQRKINGLKPGDVIYSMNRTPAVSIKALQAALDQVKPGDPMFLQVQRGERMMYLSIDLE